MRIVYKNLNVEFTYANVNEDMSGMGYSLLRVPSKLFMAFVSDSDYIENNDGRVACEYGASDIEDWLENPEHDFDTYNSDLGILFFEWCLRQDVETEFEYLGDGPIWLLHDFMHAETDVYSGIITADSWHETRAVYASMNLAKEMGLIHIFNVEYFTKLDAEYKARWNENFPIEEALEDLNELTK